MTRHPPWESLVAHADRTLPNSEAEPMRAHLLRCPTCAEEARWLRQTLAQMRDDVFPAPPATARAVVDAAFEARFGSASRAIPFPTVRQEPHLPRRRPSIEPARPVRLPAALYLWGGLAVAAALVVALLLPRLQPGVQTAAGGSLLQTSGGVTVTTMEGVERPAVDGERLAAGETLTVPAGGRIDFLVGDGSHHLALGAESVLTMTPGSTGEAVVRLARGTLVADGLKAQTLTIEAAESTVRLTEGSTRVILSADQTLLVEGRSGSVTVENDYGRQVLSPGEEVVVLPGRAPEPPASLPPAATPTPEQSAPATLTPEQSAPVETTPTPEDHEYDDNPSENDLKDDSTDGSIEDSSSDDEGIDNSGPGSVNSGRDR